MATGGRQFWSSWILHIRWRDHRAQWWEITKSIQFLCRISAGTRSIRRQDVAEHLPDRPGMAVWLVRPGSLAAFPKIDARTRIAIRAVSTCAAHPHRLGPVRSDE